MTSKKFFMGILVMVLVFGMTVVGCDNGSTGGGKTYYYEAYRITMAQCTSFIGSHPLGLDYSFSEIKGFRETLKGYGGTFMESDGGVTEAELKTFANQHGINGSAYTEAKNSLDSVGNLITFLQYAPDPTNYAIWMYVEKE